MKNLIAIAPLLALSAACAASAVPARSSGASAPPFAAAVPAAAPDAALAVDAPLDVPIERRAPRSDAQAARWIGASADGDVLQAGLSEADVGVWIDAPRARPIRRVPIDLALVIDTSGSMAGAKLESARAAAKALVENLADGDIVSIDTFSDEARSLAPPTRLSAETRPRVLARIATLSPSGSTNMFDGLALAETHVAQAPTTHAVRRVVMISDGIANVGPSSPEALGALAERGLRSGAQVTSLGVGTDYDEKTLDALAVKTTGRLYHIAEPREMAALLRRELDLLTSTVASDAFVEVVPAPGVEVIEALGVRAERDGTGALRLPIGALFAGQHREALVRVRLRDSNPTRAPRALASVRLHFRDPDDSGLERVQEVAVRASFSADQAAIASSVSPHTRSIAAVMEAGRLQVAAAQDVNAGQMTRADDQLAVAQRRLESEAKAMKDEPTRSRLMAAAQNIESSRAAFAPSAAPMAAPAARKKALDMNAAGMSQQGF